MAISVIIVPGTTNVADWNDPPTDLLPTRLNSPRHAQRYVKVTSVLPATIQFKALLDGVETLDAGLGGRLFWWSFAKYGDGPVPGFVTHAAGKSYWQNLTFRSFNTGTWVVRTWLRYEGLVLFGISVEP